LVELAPEVGDRLGGELIDELLACARSEEEIVGTGGLLAQLTKRLVERAMSAELPSTSVSSVIRSRPGVLATRATGRRRRRLRPSTVRSGSTRRGIARRLSTQDRAQGRAPL
jgi:hypothetical protein